MFYSNSYLYSLLFCLHLFLNLTLPRGFKALRVMAESLQDTQSPKYNIHSFTVLLRSVLAYKLLKKFLSAFTVPIQHLVR